MGEKESSEQNLCEEFFEYDDPKFTQLRNIIVWFQRPLSKILRERGDEKFAEVIENDIMIDAFTSSLIKMDKENNKRK